MKRSTLTQISFSVINRPHFRICCAWSIGGCDKHWCLLVRLFSEKKIRMERKWKRCSFTVFIFYHMVWRHSSNYRLPSDSLHNETLPECWSSVYKSRLYCRKVAFPFGIFLLDTKKRWGVFFMLCWSVWQCFVTRMWFRSVGISW